MPQVDPGIGSAPLRGPEIGSRHCCTPSTARVRLPVSLCHIANSKNAREFNASHNQLRPVKLRTVNSHFATLPVRHRASGMYVRSIYSVITDGQRLADVTTASNFQPIDSRCCVLAIMLRWDAIVPPPMNGSATLRRGDLNTVSGIVFYPRRSSPNRNGSRHRHSSRRRTKAPARARV